MSAERKTIKVTFRNCTICATATKWIGQRERQEDRIGLCPGPDESAPALLILLADGMGGMGNGDIAGEIIIKSYASHYHQAVNTTLQTDYLRLANSAPSTVEDDYETGRELLEECLNAANQRLAQEKLKGYMTEGAGATLIALYVTPGTIWWQSIGDSLLYHQRDSQINKINIAHNWGRLIDLDLQSGALTPQEATSQQHLRNTLSSAICGTHIPEIQYGRTELQTGDRFIIASDGLQPLINSGWEHMLNTPEIRNATSDTACKALIESLQNMNYPHQDNTAIIVLDILPPAPTEV